MILFLKSIVIFFFANDYFNGVLVVFNCLEKKTKKQQHALALSSTIICLDHVMFHMKQNKKSVNV